jgi:hypothetical protein
MKTYVCQVTVQAEVTVEAGSEYDARQKAEHAAYMGDLDGIFGVEVDILEEPSDDVDEP